MLTNENNFGISCLFVGLSRWPNPVQQWITIIYMCNWAALMKMLFGHSKDLSKLSAATISISVFICCSGPSEASRLIKNPYDACFYKAVKSHLIPALNKKHGVKLKMIKGHPDLLDDADGPYSAYAFVKAYYASPPDENYAVYLYVGLSKQLVTVVMDRKAGACKFITTEL